jgi:hypothetical protein
MKFVRIVSTSKSGIGRTPTGRCLVLTIAMIGLCVTGLASESALSGQILDQNGEPIPRAVISVHKASGERFDVATIAEANGLYSLDHLPSGEYSVRAEHPGFATVSLGRMRLPPDTHLTWTATMRVAQLGLEEPGSSDLLGVLTRNGRPVLDATVCLVEASQKWRLCTRTNNLGQYFLSVQPDLYTVTVDRGDGLAAQKQQLDMRAAGVYRDKIEPSSGR